MNELIKLLCIALGSFIFIGNANADVKLPKIISSNMVLQRDTEIKIWGWADKSGWLRFRL